jgi:hypothetical protein
MKSKMEKQTAVEWLFKNLWEEPKDKMVWYAILDKAKEMEKEQHGETWDAALIHVDKRGGVILRALVDFDEYWEKYQMV